MWLATIEKLEGVADSDAHAGGRGRGAPPAPQEPPTSERSWLRARVGLSADRTRSRVNRATLSKETDGIPHAQVRDVLRRCAVYVDGVSHSGMAPNWAIAGAGGLGPDIKLAEAPDRNPDAEDCRNRSAGAARGRGDRAGQGGAAWTYNGGLPGPLIRARVGDRLIVHFKNDLPQPTTVHWHGVRVPIEMDGVPGHFAARSQARRVLHLRLRAARRRALLVSPARDVGRAGRLRLVRRAAGGGPGRRRRRGRRAHAGLERHRLRRARRARAAGQRRIGRHGVRARRQLRARQRQQRPLCVHAPARRSAGASSTPRRAGSFYLELEGPAVHADRRRRRTAGISGDRAQAVLITPGERVDVIVTPTGEPGRRSCCARCSTTAATAASSIARRGSLTIARRATPTDGRACPTVQPHRSRRRRRPAPRR